MQNDSTTFKNSSILILLPSVIATGNKSRSSGQKNSDQFYQEVRLSDAFDQQKRVLLPEEISDGNKIKILEFWLS